MVDVVGRGTVLAGRYRVLQPLPSDLEGSTSWQATDQILDRPVRVRVLVSGHIPQALDSARRAALVSDPRLIRVLDVGSHEDIHFVVTEQVTGPSLADLLARGPLDADLARALIGETASALEVARRRGVHHLALRPSVVHITADDRVVLTGLAFDGALLGQGLGDARTTTRADAVGLVRLLYAALTGRWPASEQDVVPTSGPGTLPLAPMNGSVPVAPGDLVPGVPADLDTLCVVTLGDHDDGPHSPAELVRELEPWGEVRASGARERPSSDPTGAAAAAPVVAAAPALVQRQSVRSTFQEAGSAGTNRPGTPPPAQPSATFSPVSGERAGPVPVMPPAPVVPAGTPAAGPRAGRPPQPRTAPDVIPPATAPLAHGRGGVQGHAGSAHLPPGPPPSIPTRVPTSRSGVGGVTGGAARPQPAFGLPFDDAVSVSSVEPITQRRFDPTKLVLALVLVAVVIGVVVAFNSLFRPVVAGSDDAAPVPATTSSAPGATTPDAASTEPAPAESSEPPVSTGAAPVLASLSTIDTSDVDGEHEELVARAMDGDPATAWYTHTYNSPDYSGIKDAVGIVLNLSAPATVTNVTLTVNGAGGAVEVRSTDAANPTAGDVLASGTLAPSTVLTLSAPTETQTLVLWFTSLAQAPDGGNRIEISEIAVS